MFYVERKNPNSTKKTYPRYKYLIIGTPFEAQKIETKLLFIQNPVLHFLATYVYRSNSLLNFSIIARIRELIKYFLQKSFIDAAPKEIILRKMDSNKIYNQDCLEGLKQFENNSIDLIITSPVYKDSDGYSASFLHNVFDQLYRVLKPNGLFYLNFGHLAEDKFRPFEVCSLAVGSYFQLNDTITWVKNHYRPSKEIKD